VLALPIVVTEHTVLSASSSSSGLITTTTPVPDVIVVVLVSLGLLQVIGFVGKHISFVKTWDNALRLVIVALGIVIPLSVAPVTGDILTIFETLVKAGTSNTNARFWSFFGLSVVTIGLAVLGAYLIYRSPTSKLSRNALIGAFLIAGLVLGLPWVQTASVWFVSNVEIGFLWNFFIGVYNFFITHHFRLVSS
jgi:hypothetical protein